MQHSCNAPAKTALIKIPMACDITKLSVQWQKLYTGKNTTTATLKLDQKTPVTNDQLLSWYRGLYSQQHCEL